MEKKVRRPWREVVCARMIVSCMWVPVCVNVYVSVLCVHCHRKGKRKQCEHGRGGDQDVE